MNIDTRDGEEIPPELDMIIQSFFPLLDTEVERHDLFTKRNAMHFIEDFVNALILITKKSIPKNNIPGELIEYIKMPFKILDFKKKVVSLMAKSSFKKNSLINLAGYIIDKNERKIKKNNLELKLSEKEINFLIQFNESKSPISKNLVLKNVWNYSADSQTHTVETHIHRLRKKILEKFGDKNFIKNNNKGYYI